MEFRDMVYMQNQFCADCVAEVCHMDRQRCIEAEEARPYFKLFNSSEAKSMRIGGLTGKKTIYYLEDKVSRAIKIAPPAQTGEALK